MSIRKRNGGYTLVELMCAIAIASVITLAATSVLLLGMKINQKSSDAVRYQTNTRLLMSAFEDLSASGTIKEIHVEPDAWAIRNEEGRSVMTYEDGVIAVGGVTVLEDVTDSRVELVGQLLSYKVQTPDGVYESSVYCRSVVEDDQKPEGGDVMADLEINFESVTVGRKHFLEVLSSQLGSTGEIMVYDEQLDAYVPTENYFSLWFVGGKTEDDYPGGWNKETPWCACYVSWAINECEWYIDYDNEDYILTNNLPKFANVDLFLEDFVMRGSYIPTEDREKLNYTPVVGDIIFFDWKVDEEKDPEHVGVVADVAKEEVIEDGKTVIKTYVYTIEGNNGDEVVICKYDITNPYILGYGKLDWLKNPEERE